MADVAADEASIETEERELIHSIFEFGDTVVREVMVPRPDMVAVEADATVDEAIARRHRRGQVAAPGVRGHDRQHRRARVPEGSRRAQRRSGEGSEPVRGRCCARRTSCPSRSAWPSCCARCRPRSSTWRSSIDEYGGTAGPRHDGGPARGDRRRDHRRVRRRGAAGRAAPGRHVARARPHADRRGERAARRRAAPGRVGHRRRPGVQHARARARSRASARGSSGTRVLRGARAGPAHRVGADPRARTARDPLTDQTAAAE